MDMAAATAAVHPRASSLSHSSSCFRRTTLPALGSRPAASPCSRSSSSSSSSFCSCWDGVGQQQLRVQMVGKKSGREQVGGGGIVSTFAFDAEKPILYENGGEEPPTVVSAPNRRIVASEKKPNTHKHTHIFICSLFFFVFSCSFLSRCRKI
jgi:hypothetical protein